MNRSTPADPRRRQLVIGSTTVLAAATIGLPMRAASAAARASELETVKLGTQ